MLRHLRTHDFRTLFVEELGWDRFDQTLQVSCRGDAYAILPIAQKRGVGVFECTLSRLQLRDRRLLRRIQREVAKYSHENLVIYVDDSKTRQVWQWVTRDPSDHTLFHREHPFRSVKPPAEFLSRLCSIRVSLDQEEATTLFDILQHVATSFNRTPDESIYFRNPDYMYKAQALAESLATGEPEAMSRFLAFHDRLATWVASRFRETGVEHEDIEQLARLGLIEAARRFDTARDTSFTTYAFYWVRQSCQRHIPTHAFIGGIRPEQYWRFHRLKRKAMIQFARHDALAESEWLERQLAHDPLVGKWASKIDRIWEARRIYDTRELREAAKSVACPVRPPIEESAENDELRVVFEEMAKLDAVDALVLYHRFGLGGREYTLHELGAMLDVTRERIRQREAKAFEALGKRLQSRLSLDVPLQIGKVD